MNNSEEPLYLNASEAAAELAVSPATLYAYVSRGLVRSEDDLQDNIRHYTRQTYVRIAEQLTALVGDQLTVEQRPFVSRMRRVRRRLERNLDRAALRLQLR